MGDFLCGRKFSAMSPASFARESGHNEDKGDERLEKNRFGKMVENYQQLHEVEKKAIYRGICSGATFTRVETEERNLDYLVVETLLARMGKKDYGFESLLRQKDGELWEKRLEMKLAMCEQDYLSVDKMLQEYRMMMPKDSKLHEQFCLYHEMKLAERGGKSADRAKACSLAWQALVLTKKDGEMPHEKKNLYTPMEMDLLLTLIRYRQEDLCLPDPDRPEKMVHPLDAWKEDSRAESALWDMTEYMGVYCQNDHQEEIRGDIWQELMRLLEQSGKDDRLRFCLEKALEAFAGTNGIRRLAELHFIKARLIGRMKMGWDGSDDWKKLCREECLMAYAVCEAMEMEKELAEIKRYCREELHWHITL